MYLNISTSYFLPPFLLPISLSTSYLPPTSYLLPPFLPSTSLSTSYLPFYLLPTSYLTFYLLPFFLPTPSFSISYLPFYLLHPFLPLTSFLPPTSLSTSYLPFCLPHPFLPLTSLLPPTSLSTSYIPFYLLFLPHNFFKSHFKISLICPIIAFYNMSRSNASRGHTIIFQQDISGFAHLLPCISHELPVIVLKILNATITDRSFLVRRDKLIPALQFR